MSPNPPEASAPPADAEAVPCAGHPDIPTRLRCSRCGRPICGRCAIPATVGQHCPWCVAEARRNAPRVRSTMSATSPAVVAIVIANVAVYIAQNLVPAITDGFASYPPAIAQGQWWRLFTPMFLHAPLGSRFSLLHIGFNMFVLWIYGPHVEEVLGSARFTLLYLLCGVFGNATSYAFGPCNVLGLGASGAIFGVVGILLVILYNRRRSSFVRGFMQNLLVFVGVNLLIGFAIPGVDYWAHLGGLASGVALGAGFDVHPHRRGLAGGLQTAAAAGVLALAIGLVVTRTAGFSC